MKERTDPVGVLRRKLRADAGQQHAISDAVRQAVLAQYAAHKSWSVQLHHDNLVALAETKPELKPVPSYADAAPVHEGQRPRQAAARHITPDRRRRSRRGALADREVRSYEAEYVNGLWHWDCHHGSRKVLTARGEWVTPILFGVLDDRSRLACHLQWYLAETAEIIAHGLSQAFQKRGLPRSALSDNGAAMTAAEITARAHPARHPAPDHAALQPVSERQAGGVLGTGRGPADRHAGGCAGSHAWPSSTRRRKPGSSTSTTARSTPRSAKPRSRASSPDPT